MCCFDQKHMSPKTLKALPKSPASGGRRSSSGSSLRPVIPFGLDDGSAVEEDYDDVEEPPEMGPMPTGRTAPFAAGEGGKGVDEVEVSSYPIIHYTLMTFNQISSPVLVWGIEPIKCSSVFSTFKSVILVYNRV